MDQAGERPEFRKLSRDDINELPLRRFEGKICIINTLAEWQKAMSVFRHDGVLGFDTETKPSFRKGRVNPPALLQIATSDTVFLVQLRRLRFGREQAEILADPAIIKAGVGIAGDMIGLATLYPFEAAGCVDLGQVAEANGLPQHGLRNLSASLYGWRISKGCQCSDWNADILSQKQIIYAATDAWMSRLIYIRLCKLGMIHSQH